MTRKSPPRPPTSRDVAEAAGVSQPTVSKALRGDPRVSEATRLRILAVARQLNYRVNRNAAQLRSRETRTIALVILSHPGTPRAAINPFYLSLLGCTATAASDRGYDVLVSFQDDTADFEGRYEESGAADGMIVVGSADHVHAWDAVTQRHRDGYAVVSWGAPPGTVPAVTADNRAGGAVATRHLIDGGCRAIRFVGPTHRAQRQFAKRYGGYCDALAEAGLPAHPPDHADGLTRDDQGYATLRALLAEGASFDGIFAACDQTAIGAMRALRDAGLRVPQDVAVIGFDGIPAGRYTDPPLTTIEQDFDAAGAYLVDHLIARIAKRDVDPVRVPTRLLIRGSTRRTD